MNLSIDLGNTQGKIGLFENSILIKSMIVKKPYLNSIKNQIAPVKNLLTKAIFSSVIRHPNGLESFLKKNFQFVTFSQQTPLPIKNRYQTPDTLGKDRIAVVVGAHKLFPSKNILVIDAGTCITYDFLSRKKEYLGGSISPGINMRYKALHTFTHQLPLISSSNRPAKNNFIGTDTQSSISIGVEVALITEMKGMINLYKNRFPDLKVIITGGDGSFFERQLKNEIFAVPNLVLVGLNMILEYNTK